MEANLIELREANKRLMAENENLKLDITRPEVTVAVHAETKALREELAELRATYESLASEKSSKVSYQRSRRHLRRRLVGRGLPHL